MTLSDILKVEQEMIRLIRRIAELKQKHTNCGIDDPLACKESGAVRRASMDLSRELSELRK